ncbi:hypothetical protein Tco_1160868, partial [Tanacetum coccineum]
MEFSEVGLRGMVMDLSWGERDLSGYGKKGHTHCPLWCKGLRDLAVMVLEIILMCCT